MTNDPCSCGHCEFEHNLAIARWQARCSELSKKVSDAAMEWWRHNAGMRLTVAEWELLSSVCSELEVAESNKP